MNKIASIMILVLLAMTKISFAAEYLSADQAKALFTNKTFDGIFLPKDKKFSAYEAADGTHNVYYPNKNKHSKNREWSISENGEHCTTNKKWTGLRCSHVKDAGNGEYHKINTDGEHTHTLSNFREGNQLPGE